ncbi:hypothetical protein ACFXAO_03465 [Streptomyces lavendulae]|uniref:hypothetical protein n=1 Tax=Streptomyces lavendulae TaxID=1914 RepID=UPI0036C23116
MEIEVVHIEVDYGSELPVPYIFPADGLGGRKQRPFRLGSHAGGKAMANAAELDHAVARLGRDHRVMPRRLRPMAWTGSGIDFEGTWIEMKDVAPFLLKALRGGSE